MPIVHAIFLFIFFSACLSSFCPNKVVMHSVVLFIIDRLFFTLAKCLAQPISFPWCIYLKLNWNFCSNNSRRFYECIQELPPGLTLDLWKLFQDDLFTSYINPPTSPVPASPMKKQKRMETSSPMAGREKGLELAAVTFHHFLMAARFVDLSVTRAMLFRLQTLIGDTQTKVLQQLYDMCSQHGKEQVSLHRRYWKGDPGRRPFCFSPWWEIWGKAAMLGNTPKRRMGCVRQLYSVSIRFGRNVCKAHWILRVLKHPLQHR